MSDEKLLKITYSASPIYCLNQDFQDLRIFRIGLSEGSNDCLPLFYFGRKVRTQLSVFNFLTLINFIEFLLVIANVAKRNEAILTLWDCFASFHYARNDNIHNS